MIFIAAVMLAQAPVAQPVAKKKPEQVCQFIEVTGSHQRQRVCRDKDQQADVDTGIADAPAGMLKATPPTQPAASLGTPR